MGREIDIRIMNLNKWYVPKSFSIEELKSPVVLGYFDALQVREIRIDQEGQHPFIAGYGKQEECKNTEKKELTDFSSQEQMLFLNICQDGEEENGICFTRETVDEFWSDQSCPYVFLSMIHINHSGKLRQALQKIKRVFGKDYLSYISFDYCDIMLFAHKTKIREFMIYIKRLFEVEEGEEAVIFDTFSMVSFHPDFTEEQNRVDCGRLCGQEQLEFQATINLSIRDYGQFAEWYSDVQELDHSITRYNMFGRHDVSIVNEYADTAWLMQIMQRLHNQESRDIFWTFETYIKIPDNDGIVMVPDEPDYLEEVYQYVSENLNREIRGSDEAYGFEEIINRSQFRDKSRYLLPIYEVRDCICSIVKNSFAEEFIYCIYESFLHFVSYMKKEITYMSDEGRDTISSERKIAKEYDNYFTALNTLVNSTMHNERQFVQATAFNAVFYSVPPKIMAFYNAYIYRIKQILRDLQCKEGYTFLIYPSFSPTISVEQISLDDSLPADRLLTVRISEKSLYDIESVMYQLVHELAHYVGNGLRCRRKRKKIIVDTLVKYIAAQCGMQQEMYQAMQALAYVNLVDFGEEISGESAQWNRYEYLKYMNASGRQLLQILESQQVCQEFFCRYYQQKISAGEEFYDEMLEEIGIERDNQQAYITNLLPQYCNFKSTVLRDQMEKINSEVETYEYENYIELLKSAYSESYADLQMILVLAMQAEDYLNTFFVKQNVPAADLISDTEALIRISTVYRVMTECGVWGSRKSVQECGFDEIIACLEAYNREVEEGTDPEERRAGAESIRQIGELFGKYDFTHGIQFKQISLEKQEQIKQMCMAMEDIVPFVDAAGGLYDYLLEVMKESLQEYTKPVKQDMIKDVRNVVRKILNFEDTSEVFDCIEEELSRYKREGCRIQPGKAEV